MMETKVSIFNSFVSAGVILTLTIIWLLNIPEFFVKYHDFPFDAIYTLFSMIPWFFFLVYLGLKVNWFEVIFRKTSEKETTSDRGD